MTKNFRLILVTVFSVVFLSGAVATHVSAADVGVGLGVAAVPDYEGSSNYEAAPLPYLTVRWDNNMNIRLIGGKLRSNLIPSDMWRGGVAAEYIGERDDVENNKVDKLDDVDDSLMLGAFLGFESGRFIADIEAMGDVNDGNDGTIVRFNLGYGIPVNNRSRLMLSGFTTWADDDYMEAYFGVNERGARRSGLPVYKADSGIKDVGLNITYNCRPWENNWGFVGLAGYKLLVGDADDDSPVVDQGDENQLLGGIIVTYSF